MKQNNIFEVKETIETPTGNMHQIKWNYYHPRYLKAVSKSATDLGWLQKGLYTFKPTNTGSVAFISDRILKEFTEVIMFLATKYGLE